MAKITDDTKFNVYGITYITSDAESGKLIKTLVHVGEGKAGRSDHYLMKFKGMLRNAPQTVHPKLRDANLNLNNLSVSILAASFAIDLDKTVNFYINKFDTLNHWNTSLKGVN